MSIDIDDIDIEKLLTCDHEEVTSFGNGWICCCCGARLLSLVCPIPLKD